MNHHHKTRCKSETNHKTWKERERVGQEIRESIEEASPIRTRERIRLETSLTPTSHLFTEKTHTTTFLNWNSSNRREFSDKTKNNARENTSLDLPYKFGSWSLRPLRRTNTNTTDRELLGQRKLKRPLYKAQEW